MARITFSTMYNTTMQGLQRNGDALNKLQEQIISEKMINRPSDNPVGFTSVLRYTNNLSALGQHKINIDDGEIYMTALETAHQSMNNVYTRCQELAVRGSTDTMGHEERLFMNLDVREYLEELVALAQSKHKDNYMFSGKWTNQPPYEIKQAGINFNPANNTLPNQNFIKLQDQYPAGTGIALNPLGYNPLDPASAIFDRTETVEIQLYDNNYIDPNLKPPDNPLVQRIIPGSFELAGLVEKPYKNENLDYNHPDYNKPDYEVDYVNGRLILLSDKAKQLFFDDTTGELQVPPTLNPPPINFEYIYHNSIDMTGEIYREVESGITMKLNSNPDDLFGRDGIGNTDSFKEIISLMQGLWYNEQSEIANGIDTVNAARERNLAQQAVEGSRLNRLEMVFDRNDYSTINNTDARSRIEDVEWEDIFTKFSRADAVYNASLAAASRIMQNTLLNYI